jgi:hypothetical protein
LGNFLLEKQIQKKGKRTSQKYSSPTQKKKSGEKPNDVYCVELPYA